MDSRHRERNAFLVRSLLSTAELAEVLGVRPQTLRKWRLEGRGPRYVRAGAWETWVGRRGDVARALLYMAIRYEGGYHGITGAPEPDLELTDSEDLIDSSNTGNNESIAYMGMLSELLAWNDEDPVDDLERQRNDVVYGFQGNRNPFIDHPEWAACVFTGVCNGTPDTTPPADPTGLIATPGPGVVDLDWDDNLESDLAGYHVYRSTIPGGPYTRLTTSPVTASAYSDADVSEGTTYYYTVSAIDSSSNESGLSGEASATPDPPPQQVRNLAHSDYATSRGAVSGSYLDTQLQDDVAEGLTEGLSGGKPSKRYSMVEHVWLFDVTPGVSYSLAVDAYQNPSPDGDQFVLYYSRDDVAYTPMLTVTKTADDDQLQVFTFPEDVSGPLYILVADSDRTAGHQDLDTLWVDELYVLTELSGTPPPPPTSLHVQAITLSTQGKKKLKGRAEVMVLDDRGLAVTGATVTGTFSGDLAETASAVTDVNGFATLTTSSQATAPASFGFCVDDVSDPPLVYQPADNAVTCGSY